MSRLSFTEIILRGLCLACGVWVPVIQGWAAWLVLNGGQPTFLPKCVPLSHAATDPLKLEPMMSPWHASLEQVSFWPKTPSPFNLEHFSLPTAP